MLFVLEAGLSTGLWPWSVAVGVEGLLAQTVQLRLCAVGQVEAVQMMGMPVCVWEIMDWVKLMMKGPGEPGE